MNTDSMDLLRGSVKHGVLISTTLVTRLLSVLPQWCALAEERVHAFLAVLSEKVAGNGVSGQVVGVAERQLELTVEDLLAGRDRGHDFDAMRLESVSTSASSASGDTTRLTSPIS